MNRFRCSDKPSKILGDSLIFLGDLRRIIVLFMTLLRLQSAFDSTDLGFEATQNLGYRFLG
jgi:hypothetical protein